MFIDWQDEFEEWHTIPEPSYSQMQAIFYRLSKIANICGNSSSFEIAYDTNTEVEFHTNQILKTLKIDPEELDLGSIKKLLIDPGLIVKKDTSKKVSKSAKGKTREELIAGLWIGCESLSDVLLLLDNFTIDQVMEISNTRAKLRNPEKYRKDQIKQEAKQKVKEKANKFAEKHGIKVESPKKTKNSNKTNIPNKEREREAKNLIRRSKDSAKRPKNRP